MSKRARLTSRTTVSDVHLQTIFLLSGPNYTLISCVNRHFRDVVARINSNQDDCVRAFPNYHGLVVASRRAFRGTTFALYQQGSALFPCCKIPYTSKVDKDVSQLLLHGAHDIPIGVWENLLNENHFPGNLGAGFLTPVIYEQPDNPWPQKVWQIILAREDVLGVTCVQRRTRQLVGSVLAQARFDAMLLAWRKWDQKGCIELLRLTSEDFLNIDELRRSLNPFHNRSKHLWRVKNGLNMSFKQLMRLDANDPINKLLLEVRQVTAV
jgi:hypothetical protein